MNHTNDSCVLFFIKYPAIGLVKTRLAKHLGQKCATQVYKNFVIDLLPTLTNLNADLKIFFDPPGAKKQIQQWLGEEYSYAPQIGQNLGQKMKNAFKYAFAESFSKAVVIGSDSPDLPEDFLRQAFSALDSHDAVVGPGLDGGYYLIGFSKQSFVPQVFEGVSWSTPVVCEQTLNTLRKHKLKVHLLPKWYDVDVLSDLNKLVLRNKDTAFLKSKTLAFIHETVCQRINQKDDKND